MITSFRHKGLQELFETSKTHRLPQHQLKKLKMILATLDSAREIGDLRIPAFRLHRLKAPPLRGHFSLDVSGHYRIVFRFENHDAHDVDYLDTH